MSERRTVALRDVLTRVTRRIRLEDDTEYATLGVRWYGAGCFLKEGQHGRTIAAKTLSAVEAGDVVFSRLFAWKGSFGVVRAEHAGAIASNEFPTYRASRDLLPEYFKCWAGRESVWDEADAGSTGTTANSRNRLSEESFLALEITLPTSSDQRRIVAAVDAVDVVADTLETEISTLVDLRSATLDERLRDAPTKPIAGLIASIDAGKSPKCHDRIPHGGEWGVLKTSSVRAGQFHAREAKALPDSVEPFPKAEVRQGDILTIRASGSRDLVAGVCRVGPVPSRLLMSDYHWRLRVHESEVDVDYFVAAMASRRVRKQVDDAISGSTTAGKISQASLRSIDLPLPSLDQQQEIGRVWASTTAVIASLRLQREVLNELKAATVEDLIAGGVAPPSLEPVDEPGSPEQ